MRVAAVTMVWNEKHFLPVWRRHYARQVGEANCYVIDHGSDDGSTTNLGSASCLLLPRSPLEEVKRSSLVSSLCNGLLNYYDAVIYSDVDELLVADPLVASDLTEFASISTESVVTSVGLNVMHSPEIEPEINPNLLVSLQRSSLWFVSSMCKPLMVKKPVRWQPGFHSCDARIVFGPLYNFHLRRYDLNQGLIRLGKTRHMPRAFPELASHQAIPDQQWQNDFLYGVNVAPRLNNFDLSLSCDPLRRYVQDIECNQDSYVNSMYKINLDFNAPQRWRLPDRFVGSF